MYQVFLYIFPWYLKKSQKFDKQRFIIRFISYIDFSENTKTNKLVLD